MCAPMTRQKRSTRSRLSRRNRSGSFSVRLRPQSDADEASLHGMQLYDLAGADLERRFSPCCWRIKLALMHKGLPFDTIPWRFIGEKAIAFSGQRRVPVLIDGDQDVFNSWTIANYLKDRHPDRPCCFVAIGGRSVTRFCQCLGGCGFGWRRFAVDCDRHSHAPR